MRPFGPRRLLDALPFGQTLLPQLRLFDVATLPMEIAQQSARRTGQPGVDAHGLF